MVGQVDVCSFQNAKFDSKVNTAYILEEIMHISCLNVWLMFYLSSSFIVKKLSKLGLMISSHRNIMVFRFQVTDQFSSPMPDRW